MHPTHGITARWSVYVDEPGKAATEWISMRGAAGLICARLVRWEKSRGMAQELDFFCYQRKPIVFLDP